MEAQTAQRLDRLLVEVLKVPPQMLRDDVTRHDVEEWDSLRQMELIVAIEDEFQVKLTGEEIAMMVSFGAIRRIVASKAESSPVVSDAN